METEKHEQEKIAEQPHSVELSMNAKMQLSGKVKCYGNTPEDALKKATELLSNVEQLIKEKNQ